MFVSRVITKNTFKTRSFKISTSLLVALDTCGHHLSAVVVTAKTHCGSDKLIEVYSTILVDRYFTCYIIQIIILKH